MPNKTLVVGAFAAAIALLVISKRKPKKTRRRIVDLVRPNIATLEPYRCARDDYDSGILLDANENSIGATVSGVDTRELNRYPCPYQKELKGMIAQYR